MLGAIIGDIVGSRFEWNNNRSKDFDFLTYKTANIKIFDHFNDADFRLAPTCWKVHIR